MHEWARACCLHIPIFHSLFPILHCPVYARQARAKETLVVKYRDYTDEELLWASSRFQLIDTVAHDPEAAAAAEEAAEMDLALARRAAQVEAEEAEQAEGTAQSDGVAGPASTEAEGDSQASGAADQATRTNEPAQGEHEALSPDDSD